CAAALAVLDAIAEEGLLARAEALGDRTRARLEAFEARNDLRPIAGIRGPGAMIAFDLVTSRGGREPDGAAAKLVTARALEEGLILLSCGIHGETIRLLYPLTISDALLDEGLDRLEDALRIV
ncbi:aminotransferase class III-fold pyridoxal phosphate-dependent enzyme, partial [Phenylobacterium ferrooxidans]